jgi:hypothetical protein
VEGAVEGGARDWGEVVTTVATPAGNSGCTTRLFAGNSEHPTVLVHVTAGRYGGDVGSENPIGADNQQGSRSAALSAGGLTPQRLHAELLEADAREIRAYVSGASRDGTFSKRHKTLRISQADPRWLLALQILLARAGCRSWIYREGARNVWVIETTHQVVDPKC